MQVKNDYTVWDATLLAVQFYLEEKLEHSFRIFALDEKELEIVGGISVPVQKALDVLNMDADYVVEKGVNLSEAMIHIEFCYLQTVIKSKVFADFDSIDYNRESLIDMSEKYVETCLQEVFAKVKEYEEKLNTFTVIDNDVEFVTLIANSIAADFAGASYDVANELFGMLYGAFCRECGKMHNPFRRCGSVELK